MKTQIILFFTLIFTLKLFSQNDIKARVEFEEAETAFSTGDYNKAIENLNETEKLLGKWTPKVGYLLILSLEKTLDYESPNLDQIIKMRKQINSYMKYANNNSDVSQDKFKEIYAIDKFMKTAELKAVGESDPIYIQAKKLYEDKEYTKAYSLFEEAAQKGNAVAMDAISDMYRDAIGLEKNYQKAIEWDKKAADIGYGISMSDIGTLYFEGEGVEKNVNEALNWFIKAIDKGNTQAMTKQGTMYFNGEGIEQNYKEAMNWFKKAAEKGNKTAMSWIAHMYMNGIGIPEDNAEALKWLLKAVSDDDDYTMLLIGTSYLKGANGNNYTESMKWYQKAATKNNSMAMTGIALLFQYGRGVDINYAEALKWFLKAFDNGDEQIKIKCKEQIINIYETGGYGVPKDKKLAKEWRNK